MMTLHSVVGAFVFFVLGLTAGMVWETRGAHATMSYLAENCQAQIAVATRAPSATK